MAKGKYEYWLTDEGLALLAAWARDGLTDEQIAKNLGVSRSTLAEWKKKYSDISDTLKKGKEIVDIQVENSLLKRALGYRYTETTRESILNHETGKYELKVTKEVTKEVIADTTAQIFWLKNRKPESWRDKPIQAGGTGEENNLLDAIAESITEDIETDDLPEVQ